MPWMFDIIGLIGVAMLAYGLYLVAPVCMYVGIGALFILFAIMGQRRAATHTSKKG